VAIVAWVAARLATSFVVDRPRPSGADESVIEADDGLRSRALHTIAAAALLAGGWAVVALVALLLAPSDEPQTNTPLAFVAVTVMAVIALVAWGRGRAPFPVVPDGPRPTAPSSGASAATVRETPEGSAR
jgi:hypothetical protein